MSFLSSTFVASFADVNGGIGAADGLRSSFPRPSIPLLLLLPFFFVTFLLVDIFCFAALFFGIGGEILSSNEDREGKEGSDIMGGLLLLELPLLVYTQKRNEWSELKTAHHSNKEYWTTPIKELTPSVDTVAHRRLPPLWRSPDNAMFGGVSNFDEDGLIFFILVVFRFPLGLPPLPPPW